MVDKPFHVIWADRIGLTDRWRRDLDLCSETYGTPEYINRVDALRNDIINIKDGPSLSNMIDNYIRDDLRVWILEIYNGWKIKNVSESKLQEGRLKTEKEIRFEAKKRLHKFITQLLEDKGFGTYKSKVSEDEISLNGKSYSDNDYDILDNNIDAE